METPETSRLHDGITKCGRSLEPPICLGRLIVMPTAEAGLQAAAFPFAPHMPAKSRRLPAKLAPPIFAKSRIAPAKSDPSRFAFCRLARERSVPFRLAF